MMNNQIKLLATQSNLQDGWFCGQGNIEKFAKLIVLETLDQVNKNMELTWTDGEVKIKKHFGVEE